MHLSYHGPEKLDTSWMCRGTKALRKKHHTTAAHQRDLQYQGRSETTIHTGQCSCYSLQVPKGGCHRLKLKGHNIYLLDIDCFADKARTDIHAINAANASQTGEKLG